MTTMHMYENRKIGRSDVMATSRHAPTVPHVVGLDPWLCAFAMPAPGSGGSAPESTLRRIGSSSLVVDFGATQWAPIHRASHVPEEDAAHLALPIARQMREVAAALSLNKSLLAQVLRVSRPTVYSWLRGGEPSSANASRLRAIMSLLARASASGTAPLNARFVRHPARAGEPSLLDLLEEEELEEDRILEAIKVARRLGNSAARKRAEREERLGRLGFEQPGPMRRGEQLARNIALRDWPK